MHRIALIFVWLVTLTAAPAAQSLPSEVVRQIDALVERTRAVEQLPGVSVAVAVNGEVVFKKAYGWADLENSVPATTDSLFRTASVAKPMTAVGALELVERGKL